MLLIHPREGRDAFVDAAVQHAGLQRQTAVNWIQLSEVARGFEGQWRDEPSFTPYQVSGHPETFYAFFDVKVISRYDGFCLSVFMFLAGAAWSTPRGPDQQSSASFISGGSGRRSP